MLTTKTSKTALITGITGFVGSHLAEYLLNKVTEVCGTIRLGQVKKLRVLSQASRHSLQNYEQPFRFIADRERLETG